MDLVANDEMNVEAATKAIARLAEHAHVIDSSDEARFQAIYSEQAHGEYVSNYHLPWTPQDVQSLKKMRRSGAEFDAIARRLKRTIRGVRSRWAFELMLEREANRATALPVAAEVIVQYCDELLKKPEGWAWYKPAREKHPNHVSYSPPP